MPPRSSGRHDAARQPAAANQAPRQPAVFLQPGAEAPRNRHSTARWPGRPAVYYAGTEAASAASASPHHGWISSPGLFLCTHPLDRHGPMRRLVRRIRLPGHPRQSCLRQRVEHERLSQPAFLWGGPAAGGLPQSHPARGNVFRRAGTGAALVRPRRAGLFRPVVTVLPRLGAYLSLAQLDPLLRLPGLRRSADVAIHPAASDVRRVARHGPGIGRSVVHGQPRIAPARRAGCRPAGRRSVVDLCVRLRDLHPGLGAAGPPARVPWSAPRGSRQGPV